VLLDVLCWQQLYGNIGKCFSSDDLHVYSDCGQQLRATQPTMPAGRRWADNGAVQTDKHNDRTSLSLKAMCGRALGTVISGPWDDCHVISITKTAVVKSEQTTIYKDL